MFIIPSLSVILGTTESEMVCLKFGLITEETDVEELVGMVQTVGKEIEQSSKVSCKHT